MDALIAIATIAAGKGGIWLVVMAFQDSLLWGFGCLLIPFCVIVYAAMHWSDAKKPLLLYVIGGLIATIGRLTS